MPKRSQKGKLFLRDKIKKKLIIFVNQKLLAKAIHYTHFILLHFGFFMFVYSRWAALVFFCS